ncbi:unnamed protein product [Dracunculus medinensis]|uniref:Small ribosomal subunit protein mS23 n=1 Tax=Dracunculus medinensis TaxID=318479 RepID=A0A0N4U7Q4_DRAME|nr:unnamed protein product [Dracunculus medinensis]
MAGNVTRAERTGSIFHRYFLPLWYDVYASIPPYIEPVWNAKYPKENEPVTSIFYHEDLLRAKFYKKFPSVGAINVENEKSKSVAQIFIEIYNAELSSFDGKDIEMTEDKVFDMVLAKMDKEGISISPNKITRSNLNSGRSSSEAVNYEDKKITSKVIDKKDKETKPNMAE